MKPPTIEIRVRGFWFLVRTAFNHAARIGLGGWYERISVTERINPAGYTASSSVLAGESGIGC
jgi:hypothetical protein